MKSSTVTKLGVGLALLLTMAFSLPSCRRVERSERAAATSRVTVTEGGIEMALIPAGIFLMGSDPGLMGSDSDEADERPVHEVQVDAFLMDRFEMTQEHFARLAAGQALLARDPSHFKGSDRPAEMVSWADAALLCNARSRAGGLGSCYDEETGECDFQADGYRLPTEAEWEYACRAGSTTDYYFGAGGGELDRYGWFKDNAGEKTHPVGRKQPNAWGLYDMHGNVAEWCNDMYDEGYYRVSPRENPRGPGDADRYVLRGGAWNCTAEACRSSRRVGEDPGFQDACFARDAIGFRCVRRVYRSVKP